MAQVVQAFKLGFEDFSNLGGFLWSERVKMRPAIGGEKAVLSPQSSIFNPQSSVLSPQSSVLRNAQKQCFCSQKLDLRHFSRECRENLNIRTLRIKFRNKSGSQDYPNLCQPAYKLIEIFFFSEFFLWADYKKGCGDTGKQQGPLASFTLRSKPKQNPKET